MMTGEGVARVLISKHSAYLEGDIVFAPTGWRTHVLSDGTGLRKLDPARAPVTTALRRAWDAGVHGVLRPPADRQTEARRKRYFEIGTARGAAH